MTDQEPIRPEQIPDHLIELFDHNYRGTSPRQATRAGLAAVLTEVCERIAQAVEAELTDDLGDMLVVTVEGQRAAAIIRSWPEELDG